MINPNNGEPLTQARAKDCEMNSPKIYLRSDFTDYYDYHFNSYSPNYLRFTRLSKSGMSRQEMFEFFTKLGISTPIYGKVKEVGLQLEKDYNKINPKFIEQYQQVVVYLDQNCHRGEGKIKVSIQEGLNKYPNLFCSQYIVNTRSGNGLSWRHLQIGDLPLWLEYSSENDWRSNCGDVEIKILEQDQPQFHPKICNPLWAIDFVFNGIRLHAIDFNIAPQVKGTGIENILSAKDCANAIKRGILKRIKECA